MRRPAVVSVLLALAMLVFPAAAHADNGTVSDPAKDAPAAIDITSATFGLTNKAATMTLHVRNLTSAGTFKLFVYWYNPRADVVTVRKVRGKVKATYTEVDYSEVGPTTYTKVSCKIPVRWNAKRNVIRVGLPNSCSHQSTDEGPYQLQAGSARGKRHDATGYQELSF